jgi:hypothetical protein
MNYSTLQEAYNIDTFEKKKPVQKQNKNNGSMIVTTNTSPSFVESSKLALNSNKLSDFPTNSGNSCAPLQAPSYNIPVSNECKKEHDDAMNVYTNINNNNNMMNMMNPVPINANNSLTQSSTQSLTTPPPASTMSSLNNSASLYNNIKSSSDNVMPYYDEDLEQYFNINNLNDEVKYNSYAYMPNTNKQPYTNNDTSQYTNNSNIPKNGNNLLNNSSYNLTPEEKKNAEDAIQFLKSIEDKINNGNINSSGYNKTSIADPVIPPENTGPGGFKVEGPNKNIENPVVKQDVAVKQEKSGNNYIYNAIFNISILLIIGIAIILLCDQIVELSIQIGMKRVVNILEPYIKPHVHELVNSVNS